MKKTTTTTTTKSPTTKTEEYMLDASQEDKDDYLQELLRKKIYEFSDVLDRGGPPEELVTSFFHPHAVPSVHEYGPQWAYEVLKYLGEWKGYPSESARRRAALDAEDEDPDDSFGFDKGPRNETPRGDVLDYMKALGSLLTPMKIVPNEDTFQYDLRTLSVSCTGEGTFRANNTGQTWKETWCWLLVFEQLRPELGIRGNPLKILSWEIFADPLSAWLAVKGEHPDHEGTTKKSLKRKAPQSSLAADTRRAPAYQTGSRGEGAGSASK